MKKAIKYYLIWFCIYLPLAMSYKFFMRDQITTLAGIIVIALLFIPVFLKIFKDKSIDLDYSKQGEFNVPYPILKQAIKFMEVEKHE